MKIDLKTGSKNVKGESNRKKVLLAGCVTLAMLICGIFLVTLHVTGQKNSREDATTVKPGNVTPEEQTYSDEIAKMYPDRDMTKLSSFKEGIGVGLGGPGDYVTLSNEKKATVATFMTQMACEADAVLAGHTTSSKEAHLSADETFVYTQSTFVVDTVLKDNVGHPIAVNDSVQVVRPGGDIILNGHYVEVKDFSFQLLDKQKRYLLFLTYVPDAKGYIVLREGDLELGEKRVRKLSSGKLNYVFKDNVNPQALITQAGKFTNAKCRKVK